MIEKGNGRHPWRKSIERHEGRFYKTLKYALIGGLILGAAALAKDCGGLEKLVKSEKDGVRTSSVRKAGASAEAFEVNRLGEYDMQRGYDADYA